MVEVLKTVIPSVSVRAAVGTPTKGEAIYIRRPMFIIPEIPYGKAFFTNVKIKNTGNVKTTYRVQIALKEIDGEWVWYAYTETSEFNPGETKTITIAKAFPGGYLIRIPAFADPFNPNAVIAEVWKGEMLDREVENYAFYAKPVGEFSLGVLKHCFCEGMDKNGNPINPKTRFSKDEKLCYLVKTYYDRRGYRHTMTIQRGTYIPETSYHDVPSGKNWKWHAICWGWKPPLTRGKWTIWYRVAGNYCIKDTAYVK